MGMLLKRHRAEWEARRAEQAKAKEVKVEEIPFAEPADEAENKPVRKPAAERRRKNAK